uniref:Uncharacterized protein n=1 Tax=Chromera velia CCMP2878 TaxID=1169474 RepID=A0A0G4I585_9ALVE|eukprot:Cvel_36045.t1-p1 / transcript=Cvel_36045.t1 / gene=Cvel_36045 / organism=Chromera_velia_CCMP2878 / gene_product=hypothetical protein / transcript_product=hypothetical protein / location=Cvel_scaffold6893:998-1717(-) / protein_length=240 / sequence_SO=supercontig / SO=protein_coding / is_pseudo=false
MLSNREKERKTHAAGRAQVREWWEKMDAFDLHCAHDLFLELPGEGEACPDCRCCGQSVRACNRRWAGMLKVETDAIKHYYGFKYEGMEVGFGCAMDLLLETSRAKHHTDLSILWANAVDIFALMKGPEVAKYVAMGGRVKPRQEMERRFPSVYLSIEEVIQLMTENRKCQDRLVSMRAPIYCLSYSWHSAEHPDPTGSTAKTVMKGLEEDLRVKNRVKEEFSCGKRGGGEFVLGGAGGQA